MEKKEKIEKNITKNNTKKIIWITVLLVFFLISAIINFYLNKEVTYASSDIGENEKNQLVISKKGLIDLNQIIYINIENKEIQEVETQEIEIEYLTQYKENSELPKNESKVLQEGRNGIEQITISRKYVNNELMEEKEVNKRTIKATINKIVEIGTANYTSNYKAKVGDEIYVTSKTLSVMTENSSDSLKIATIFKDDKLKIIEISGEWYKVSCSNIIGWVKKECTTNISPSQEYTEEEEGLSKSQLLSKLSFNMSLYKPSGFTLEQFKKVLTDDNDVNKVFQNNAKYFYYIEKQYNINGIFIAAVGIHESAWGTSKISLNKYNLFGYGAYDSNPYNSAYDFSDYSECIDLIARVFVKYYLNPAGTKIYGDEVASGKYYNGNNLSGVNTKYATDKNWANSVYKYMQYLYNKL